MDGREHWRQAVTASTSSCPQGFPPRDDGRHRQVIPQTHRDFVAKSLADLGVPPLPDDEERSEGVLGWLHSVARSHVEWAQASDQADRKCPRLAAEGRHRPGHAAGVPVAALAGSAKHAQRHVENGVDIVIAQGYEAGGTPERSHPWCWCRKYAMPSTVTQRSWLRVASGADDRWPRR